MRVVVVGAGIAGLGATLAFARRGHEVTLLERDRTSPPGDPALAFDEWARPGVGHFRQPQLFLSGGVRGLWPDLQLPLRPISRRARAADDPIALRPALVLGLQPVGDALAHTNPSWGWGLSIALAQAVELAELADGLASRCSSKRSCSPRARWTARSSGRPIGAGSSSIRWMPCRRIGRSSERAAALMAERRRTAPAPTRPGPTRDHLLRLMGEAIAGSAAPPG